MLRDLRYAVRSLLKNRSFTAVIVITLGLGIGANAALFSVVNAVVLRELPFAEPEQLYKLETAFPDGRATDGALAPLEVERLTSDNPLVQAAAGTFRYEGTALDPEGNPLKVLAYAVTDGFFDIFRARMALGRPFIQEDYEQPETLSLILSNSLWRSFFGSNPAIVGSTIRIEGTIAEVVGIAGPDFDFPRGTDVWAPMAIDGPEAAGNFIDGYARITPDTSWDQFQASLTVFREDLQREFPNRSQLFLSEPLRDAIVGDLEGTLLILLGATGILLLIACVNVTNLLLSRATARAREVAIRSAVGAGQGRIVRQLLTESLVLSTLGGLLGLGLAFVGVRALVASGPADLPRMNSIPLDGTVLAFAGAVVLLVGLIVGITPAIRIATTNLRSLVNEGGRGNSAGPAENRIFSTLVVAEIALAVLLVTGAGLLASSYSGLRSTETGFSSDGRLTLELALPMVSWAEYPAISAFYRDLVEQIRLMPGVESAGVTSTLPLGDELDYIMPFQIVGEARRPEEEAVQGRLRAVTPDLFPALGTPLVRGRALVDTDRRGAPGVAVVNETFVRQFFPGRNPLGERVEIPQIFVEGSPANFLGETSVESVEIVGIMADVKYASLAENAEAAIYLPFDQATFRRATVVVHSSTDNPASLVGPIRNAISDLEPLIPVEFQLYPQIVSASIARERLGMLLFAVFGVVALALATIGVYGVISFSVSKRTGEIAVRATLGASRSDVLRLVLGHGARLATGGVVLGMAAALAMNRILANQLYEMSALDPRVFVPVPLALLSVALLATLLPALRAARIDPAMTLRGE